MSPPYAHTFLSLLALITLSDQDHNEDDGGGMGEQRHSKQPAHILISHSHTQDLCTALPVGYPNIFLPMVPPHCLDPGAIAPPQYSFLIFFHACSLFLLSLLRLPKVGTCHIQPIFSLFLLKVGDLILQQRCAEFWGSINSETCKHTILDVQLPGQKHLLGKLGYLKLMMFCSFSLACSKTNPAGSSWSKTLYSPLAARPNTCWKILQLRSPTEGHQTCIQDSKSRKHVINHRNTLLQSIENISLNASKLYWPCKETT